MPNPANLPRTIIFLHIPKAAGTSLKRILDKNYDPAEIFFLQNRLAEEAFRRLPDADKQCYRLIYGHHYFGLHACLPQTAGYISILRGPVERVLSHYYFVRREESNPRHQQAMELALEDYIFQGVASNALDNGQTRHIAGVCDETPCDEAMFELAKTNIENHFLAIGLSERFDESLLLVKEALGLSKVYYWPLNRTRHPKQDQVSSSAVDLIKERNQYDLMLYDYVENRLNRQLREQPPGFQRSLRSFKTINWFYGTPHRIVQAAKGWMLTQRDSLGGV